MGAGHGQVTLPPNRAGGTLDVAGIRCPQKEDGTQTPDGCAWLTPMIQITGSPTLVDPLLLTTEESIADPDAASGTGWNPWRNPGSVPVKSPCGNNFWNTELDGLDLAPNPKHTAWVAGSNVKVANALYVNHGGSWSRNPIPAAKEGHDTSKGLEFEMPSGMEGAQAMSWDFSIVEELSLPADLVPGEYLLSWRWDCEKSSQVWFTCADITVESAAALV